MRGDALDNALTLKRPSERVDAVLDIMRETFKKSTIGYFNGAPYFFGGRIYEPMTWDDFGNLIYDLMRQCQLPNGDYNRVDSVIRVCRRAISGKQLRPDNSIVVMKNCVFDVKTNKTHGFNKRYVQMTSVDFDYNPDEFAAVWHNFLDFVLPNQSVQKVLQEFLGSIFIDRNEAKMEQMIILKGAGGNGKSVIFETVMGLLGKENVSNFGISALLGGVDRKKNIAFINGKRLNYCSEIQTTEFGRDSDALKALISGEPTEARPLYGENFTAYNIPLLMANANKLPYLKDWSHGMRRRIIIIPFEQTIPEKKQNKSLARELQKDYPGIFNWVLAGRARFIANGYKLTQLQALEDAADEYQAESSSVLQFMIAKDYNRAIIDNPEEPKWLQAKSLYGTYQKWCVERNITVESEKKFFTVLSDAGYQRRRDSDGVKYGVFLKKPRKVPGEYRGPNYNKMIYGLRELAHYTRLPFNTIQHMKRMGVLEGTYRKCGNKCMFKLPDAKEAALKFVRDKKKQKELQRVSREVRAMRRCFNARMDALGEPYRKYSVNSRSKSDSIIYVEDDWDYDLEMGLDARKHQTPEFKAHREKLQKECQKRKKKQSASSKSRKA
jgi:P4 family phage/plasmid primase-like protien